MIGKWNLKAIAVGVFICIVVSFVTTMVLSVLWAFAVAVISQGKTAPENVVSPLLYGITLFIDLGLNFAAGLAVARMSPGAEMRNTGVVAGVYLAFVITMVLLFPPTDDVRRVVDYCRYALTAVPLLAAYVVVLRRRKQGSSL